ncbi:DUF6384 family protein [Roseibium sediminis]|uniref:DUF6384 family protein n=1 Tax=Roseibium sediminis TaxID=1775174 RepID=UPI00123CA0CF|nr:DUF6384 family protein [Roseibium sediminis]
MANEPQAPLDDLMMAMDVVDTLRHEQKVVETELAEEDRDSYLMGRLREIYKSQGIDVPDHILKAGVEDLKADRFVYQPRGGGLSRTLATIYVTRATWSKWAGGILVALIITVVAWQFLVVGPRERAALALQQELTEGIPQSITSLSERIQSLTRDKDILAEADRLATGGRIAAEDSKVEVARKAVTDLRELATALNEAFEVRIVSRPGAKTGVERIPDVNRNSANYYLVVEAIGPDGSALKRKIVSEENSGAKEVTIWGQRVTKALYEKIRDDKVQDGIVQESLLGTKKKGVLDINWKSGVKDGAITEW